MEGHRGPGQPVLNSTRPREDGGCLDGCFAVSWALHFLALVAHLWLQEFSSFQGLGPPGLTKHCAENEVPVL